MSDVKVAAIGKSDADRANEIKAEIMLLLEPLCKAIDGAGAAGFVVNFGLATGPIGKQIVSQLKVIKEF